MNNSELLEMAEQAPDECFVEVKNDYKPQAQISDDILGSLQTGKEDIAAGQQDEITMPEGSDIVEVTQAAELGETAAANVPAGDSTTRFNLGELIPPATALDIMELLIVFIGTWGVSKFLNTTIEKDHLKFSPEEKATLLKPLKRCFEETQTATKNPWIALLIAFVCIMCIKAATIYQIVQEQHKNDPPPPDIAPMPFTANNRKKGRGRPAGKKNNTPPPPPTTNSDIILQP